MSGGNHLKAEVLSTSACSLCGACLDWCPYLQNMEDHLVLRFDCPVEEGRCYSVCPRTKTDWEAIQKQCLPDLLPEIEMGGYLAIYRARSTSPVNGVQDGGVVSSLLGLALKEQMIDGVLVTGGEDALIPQPQLVSQIDELAGTAGSRFLATPSLRKFVDIQGKGWQRVAVVGRPCQVQALRKLQVSQLSNRPVPEVLSIGLFCMWSLSWSFMDYVHDIEPNAVFTRMAIPQHGVELTAGEKTITIPTEQVRKFIRPGCNYCLDMTSELADISVGAFEAESGWNTLVVRSKQGAELLAKADAVLEIKEYPASELERLKSSSLHKKARNLAIITEAVTSGRLSEFIDLKASHYTEIKERAGRMVNC